MKIGLISDTRVRRGEEVPPEVIRAFEGVDLIIHAGNIYSPDVLDWLEQIAPVKATGRIFGYRDVLSMECQGDARVALAHILELEGHTIGVMNNLELRSMSDEIRPGAIGAQILPNQSLPSMVDQVFGTSVDIVVFGRTLYAMVEEHQGILFVNPGSTSLPRNLQKLGSVAILDLTPDGTDARVIELAAFS